MDWKLLITGALPAFLAIIAERWNPVSAEKIKDESDINLTRNLLNSDQEKEFIQSYVSRSAENAVEVSALVPTWISSTAGVVAASLEVADPLVCATISVIWIATSALIGANFFSKINYNELSSSTTNRFAIKIGDTKAKFISNSLIIANIIVILVVLAISILHTPSVGERKADTAPMNHSNSTGEK